MMLIVIDNKLFTQVITVRHHPIHPIAYIIKLIKANRNFEVEDVIIFALLLNTPECSYLVPNIYQLVILWSSRSVKF